MKATPRKLAYQRLVLCQDARSDNPARDGLCDPPRGLGGGTNTWSHQAHFLEWIEAEKQSKLKALPKMIFLK